MTSHLPLGKPGSVLEQHEGWIKMAISDRTVAIVGTGNLGGTLAAAFAAGGQDFLLAGRDQEAVGKMAADFGGHAEAVSVDEAVVGPPGRAGIGSAAAGCRPAAGPTEG